jgi:hypothetical protein
MVNDEVRKRGSSRCILLQLAAEQLLIVRSPKNLLSHESHLAFTTFDIPAATSPAITLPHADRIWAAITHAVAHIAHHKHNLLFSRCTPMCVVILLRALWCNLLVPAEDS